MTSESNNETNPEKQGVGDWKDITTAPRDGTTIEVRADDDDGLIAGPHYMRWEAQDTNAIFQPNTMGIWVQRNNLYTWSEVGGFGPEQWREVPS